MEGLLDDDCFAIRQAARYVSQLYDRHLANVGLTITQFSLLGRLKRTGPMTMKQMAEAMRMQRTTLVRTIQPLRRNGLVSSEALGAESANAVDCIDGRRRSPAESSARTLVRRASRIRAPSSAKSARPRCAANCSPLSGIPIEGPFLAVTRVGATRRFFQRIQCVRTHRDHVHYTFDCRPAECGPHRQTGTAHSVDAACDPHGARRAGAGRVVLVFVGRFVADDRRRLRGRRRDGDGAEGERLCHGRAGARQPVRPREPGADSSRRARLRRAPRAGERGSAARAGRGHGVAGEEVAAARDDQRTGRRGAGFRRRVDAQRRGSGALP